MKKLMATVLFVALGFTVTSACFAAAPEKSTASKKHELSQIIRGTITAVNATANQISVQQDESKKVVVVTVPKDELTALKEGARVKVTLKAGSADQAEKVKVLKTNIKK